MTQPPITSTGDEWGFPDWLPDRLRTNITDFWTVFGRTVADYHKDAERQRAPQRLAEVTLKDFCDVPRTGQFLHKWNNIGLVYDGEIHHVSF